MIMDNYLQTYIEFASKISFFEFTQREFRESSLDVLKLKKEISILKAIKKWNIDNLADYIIQHPRSFFIFQDVFQLLRFTNAQLIHFIFDIDRLNSSNIGALFEYFIFNLKYDIEFRKEFKKLHFSLLKRNITYEELVNKLPTFNKQDLVAIFKITIAKYIDKISKSKKFFMLEKRIKKPEFSDFSIRFSRYLIENLRLNEMIKTMDIEKYLEIKRIPVDTKKLHGDFAKLKIKTILDKNNFVCIDEYLKKLNIKTLPLNELSSLLSIKGKTKSLFCTEKYVEGIVKRNGRPKKFDLVILQNFKPKYLFEINFYTTQGTKIGINEDEYVHLLNLIKNNFSPIEFHWITDGNSWLTSPGRATFLRLIEYFGTIYNIHLFAQSIDKFKERESD